MAQATDRITATSQSSKLPRSCSTEADAVLFGQTFFGSFDFDAQITDWDRVTLGGYTLPGKADVSGHGIDYQMDTKKPSGANGATTSNMGREVGRFEIKLHLWTASQWARFCALLPKLMRMKNQKLEVVTVVHPAINVLGIDGLMINKIGVPHTGHQPGIIEIDFSCIEFLPPSKTNVTVTARTAYDSSMDRMDKNSQSIAGFSPDDSDMSQETPSMDQGEP